MMVRMEMCMKFRSVRTDEILHQLLIWLIKFRTDGLVQKPSNDDKAPNMENGHVKSGEILFVFSQQEGNMLPNVKLYLTQQKGWNFHDAKVTKELNLTHNLIAEKAGFATLIEIYNGDPILAYVKNKVKPCDGSSFYRG